MDSSARFFSPNFATVLLTALAGLLAGGIPLRAQPASPPPAFDAAAQAAGREQREEQDRARDQLRRDQERQPGSSFGTAPMPAPKAKISLQFTGRFQIDKLFITGANHASAKFLSELRHRYEGTSVGVNELQELLGALTEHYIKRGYVTTRVYVPNQDLAKHRLLLLVVEGRIERITRPGALGNIFPAHAGDLLNLRDLEQGIDNLNRLPSHQATLDLLPGTEAGSSIVGVHDDRTKPWHLDISGDNTGSEGTGRDQASASLSLDDLLGLGEGITVSHRTAVPYHEDSQASQTSTASLSVPWGYQSFTLCGSTSTYAMSFAAPSGADLPFTGSNKSVNLRTDRVVYRGQTARVGVYANLTWKYARNYLLGTIIDVSSRDTTEFEVGANLARPLAGGLLSVDGSASHGLGWFGSATDPDGLPSYAPRSEFSIAKLATSWSRGFRLAGANLNFATSLDAQYSPNVLYGVDQETIGGLYAVRGFDQTNLAGDSGYVWRNDLGVVVPLGSPSSTLGKVRLKPYVGLDQGHAWTDISGIADFSGPQGSLLGGAVGTSISFSRYSGDIFFAKPLRRTSGMPYEAGRVYFRFNGSF